MHTLTYHLPYPQQTPLSLTLYDSKDQRHQSGHGRATVDGSHRVEAITAGVQLLARQAYKIWQATVSQILAASELFGHQPAPSIQVTDVRFTFPHHGNSLLFSFSCYIFIYRARDKEKYRLRKQQKRNDIEAFRYALFIVDNKYRWSINYTSIYWRFFCRKMQQLRKEFTTAKNLLQLILERELLREVRNAPDCFYRFVLISPMVVE